MKKIYWRPRAVSRTALSLVALLSVLGLLLVENCLVRNKRPFYAEKFAAAQLALQAMREVKSARMDRSHAIDWLHTDPTDSGLIGVAMTEVTSVAGNLLSKQTSVNPNFAAVIVDMLKKIHVGKGDVVAVGCTGSFPVINICVYAALETLEVQPIVISSVSASQWGANLPDFLWTDMEKALYDAKLISFRSAAASIGGSDDLGLSLSRKGKKLARDGILRNGILMLEAKSFKESVSERIKIYTKRAGAAPIKAYINVGGGAVSAGRRTGRKIFRPGLNRRAPSGAFRIEGVMPRFSIQGVPVIHLVQIIGLAKRYGLAPQLKTNSEIRESDVFQEFPRVGQADVFVGSDYNRWLVGGVLAAILVSLYGLIRTDVGYRLLMNSPRRERLNHPEPMI